MYVRTLSITGGQELGEHEYLWYSEKMIAHDGSQGTEIWSIYLSVCLFVYNIYLPIYLWKGLIGYLYFISLLWHSVASGCRMLPMFVAWLALLLIKLFPKMVECPKVHLPARALHSDPLPVWFCPLKRNFCTQMHTVSSVNTLEPNWLMSIQLLQVLQSCSTKSWGLIGWIHLFDLLDFPSDGLVDL